MDRDVVVLPKLPEGAEGILWILEFPSENSPCSLPSAPFPVAFVNDSPPTGGVPRIDCHFLTANNRDWTPACEGYPIGRSKVSTQLSVVIDAYLSWMQAKANETVQGALKWHGRDYQPCLVQREPTQHEQMLIAQMSEEIGRAGLAHISRADGGEVTVEEVSHA